MTRAEKFKEVFGFELNEYQKKRLCTMTACTLGCPLANQKVCKRDSVKYWDGEYKEGENATTG